MDPTENDRPSPSASGTAAKGAAGVSGNGSAWGGAAGPQAGRAGAAPRGSFGAAMRDGTLAAARAIAPGLRQKAAEFANWLVLISWGKFFLLSVLLLILSAVAFSLFFSGSDKSRPIDHGEITVHVRVVPQPDGSLRIQSAEGPDGKSVDIQPNGSVPKPRRKIRKGTGTTDDNVLLQIDGEGDPDNPEVRIDRQGVRILADEDGDKRSVIIDHKGVRIERVAPPSAAAAQGAKDAEGGRTEAGGAAAQPQGDDAQKVAAAVEAARDQIESILQDQVDNKLEAFHLGDEAERENWLATLAVLAIIVAIILKVALGSKTRAESQARRASETAAQEGLKRQLAEARVKMMQAQVEPHFLFNTLASVDHLIETDPSRASRMQKNLIQYLRAALPQMREGSSSLGREIQQCRSYLEILKLRMDERLQFSINVPQGLQSAAFPPMMLLTLVENAIKHGLEPKSEGGSISVGAVVSNGALQVSVADSGLGFGVAQRGGTGLGLANVRERLQALYGASGFLQIEANAGGGTIATIVVPYSVDPSAVAGPAAAGASLAAGAAG
jgi:hypothetical protein